MWKVTDNDRQLSKVRKKHHKKGCPKPFHTCMVMSQRACSDVTMLAAPTDSIWCALNPATHVWRCHNERAVMSQCMPLTQIPSGAPWTLPHMYGDVTMGVRWCHNACRSHRFHLGRPTRYSFKYMHRQYQIWVSLFNLLLEHWHITSFDSVQNVLIRVFTADIWYWRYWMTVMHTWRRVVLALEYANVNTGFR